jgi:hypothetical protein
MRMIYRQLLNDGFDRLPAALRAFHSAPGGGHAVGTASVRHQNGLLARLLRFPRAALSQPVRLDVIARETEEIWTRTFGTSERRSVQRARAGLLIEDLGPFQIEFRVTPTSEGMRFQSARARVLGIRVPMHVEASAVGDEHSWNFEVTISHVGSYSGTMELVK